MTGVCERAGKEQKESRHVQVKFPVGLNLQEPKLLGSKFLGGIQKSGKLKSLNSEEAVNHPLATENILNFDIILSHSILGHHDNPPMNVIHQKNSNPLVIARFKGFHDLLN